MGCCLAKSKKLVVSPHKVPYEIVTQANAQNKGEFEEIEKVNGGGFEEVTEREQDKILKMIRSILGKLDQKVQKTETSKIFSGIVKMLEVRVTEVEEIEIDFNNLMEILCEMIQFAEEITKEERNFWTETKNFVVMKSQPDSLVILLHSLLKILEKNTKVFAELIQVINDKKGSLQIIARKMAEILKNIEGNGVFMPEIIQVSLSNEEAILFWSSSFFDRFMIPLDEFKSFFFDYFEETKKTIFSENQRSLIFDLLKKHSPSNDSNVNAKEINTFFENIPFDIKWGSIEAYKEIIGEKYKARAEKTRSIREITKARLANPVDNEEKADFMKKNPESIRFVVKKALFQKCNVTKETVVELPEILINTSKRMGSFWAQGKDSKGEFILVGDMTNTCGNFFLKKTRKTHENVNFFNADFREIDKVLYLLADSAEGNLRIELDLRFCMGFRSEAQGEMIDFRGFFIYSEKKLMGLTMDDGNSLYFWDGVVYNSEVNAIRSEIEGEETTFEGRINVNDLYTELTLIAASSKFSFLSFEE